MLNLVLFCVCSGVAGRGFLYHGLLAHQPAAAVARAQLVQALSAVGACLFAYESSPASASRFHGSVLDTD
jgi:hypothetical protein